MTRLSFRLYFFFLLILLFAQAPFSANAQETGGLSRITRSYALQDVTIIPMPGMEIKKGTVIIKDGLIAAVGQKVEIPKEAIIIQADSMYVYPGFIDGFSRAGVVETNLQSNEELVDRGNPPPTMAGLTPQVTVRSFLDPRDKSIDKLRSVGFTSAQVIPEGNFMPGQAALILLGAGSLDKLILKESTALYSNIKGTRGIYPSTVMGVMAKWKELYRQTELAIAYQARYEEQPKGMERPFVNAILESLYPVVKGERPVVFNCSQSMGAHRALILQNELSLAIQLGDLKEGWLIVDRIKNEKAVAFLSLDLPDGSEEYEKNNHLTQEEQQQQTQRELEFRSEYISQAAYFEQRDIPFGFSTYSVSPKSIKPNIRQMIKAGLSEEKALAALTTVPASLLGVEDQLGSIEEGKIANLILTDGPYFDEASSVYIVFVDGVPYYYKDVEERPKGKPLPTLVENATAEGNWTIIMKNEDLVVKGLLEIQKKEGAYKGTFTAGNTNLPTTLKDIEQNGNTLTFNFILESNMRIVEMLARVELTGANFEGKASGGSIKEAILEGKKIKH